MLRKWNFEIHIEKESNQPIYLQIADAIIKDIQSGRLKPADPLPGSRSLAEILKVNRNTVVQALDVLIIEQWLVSKPRKGTFVAESLPDLSNLNKFSSTQIATEQAPKQQFYLKIDDGIPDSKIAPIAQLARAYRKVFNIKGKWQMMGYANELGSVHFRESIAKMLNHQRAMQVNKQNICITRGSQMAMYLTAHCLLEKGDFVLVEDPGYKPAWKAFQSAGANLQAIQVDKNGLIIQQVVHCLENNKKIKAVYITPHRQYPTTVTLSLERRLELIQLSNEYGFTIIEDDYDNEFHFGHRPVVPVSSFSKLKNYIYIGTMSKVVAPALRIGYLVSNNLDFIEKVADLRKIIDVQSDSIMEKAILQLIEDGTIKRHLKKATLYYKHKRDLMLGLVDIHLKDKVSYVAPQGGLALWIVPKKAVNWIEIAKKLQEKGITITTPDHYSFDKTVNGLRIGYGAISESEMQIAIDSIAKELE
ncbi:MocR-like pyridoxine biosynthesis transcription factor PdxR [Myroides sp. LJL119]